MGYLPWQRPGIDLGIKLGDMAKAHPEYVGVVLGSHGLFTWANDARTCYDTTLRIINKAAVWLERNGKKPAFKGEKVKSLPEAERRKVARRLLPEIRGRISKHEMKVGHFVDSSRGDGIREFQAAGTAGAARHLLPRSLPAHQDPPAHRAA